MGRFSKSFLNKFSKSFFAQASHVEAITRLDSLIFSAILEHIADAIGGGQGQWRTPVELCAIPIHLGQRKNLLGVRQWGLVSGGDLDRHRAWNVHAWVRLKERNAALGIQDTAPCACLQERPAQRRINSVSIQTNIGIGQMHKVVNCNSLFSNRSFGSSLLFRGERRALVNDNAGWQSEMNIPIPRQRIRD